MLLLRILFRTLSHQNNCTLFFSLFSFWLLGTLSNIKICREEYCKIILHDFFLNKAEKIGTRLLNSFKD